MDMTDYLYDGSFQGLLSCIYDHYYLGKASGIYPQNTYQSSLLKTYKLVVTDEDKARKVYNAIEEKISPADLRRVYNIYLSSEEGKEINILEYLILGFKNGPKIRLLHSHPVVYQAQQIEKKVQNEVHRLTGLVRFSALSGNNSLNQEEEAREILYCPLEPDHDVIELLGDHFSDRLKNDPFIIHDKKRGKALFSYGGSFYISEYKGNPLSNISGGEKQWQSLWRDYFNTIAIKERINPKCQRSFMPVRYWKNLTEFKGPGEDIFGQ